MIRGTGTRRNSDGLILFQEIVAYPAARCLLKSEVNPFLVVPLPSSSPGASSSPQPPVSQQLKAVSLYG